MASVAASEMRRARVASGFAAPSPRLVWHVGLALLVLAVLAGLLGQFASFMLWIEPGRLTFVWIPGGLLMALLMLRSRQEWAVWVVGVTAGGVAAGEEHAVLSRGRRARRADAATEPVAHADDRVDVQGPGRSVCARVRPERQGDCGNE